MSTGACQQCWVDCEKWKFHPKIDLFDFSDSSRAQLVNITDIVTGSALRLGEGWGGIERFDGEVFRWVENDAEIILERNGRAAAHVAMLVEPGPGLGGEELSLTVLDSAGIKVGSQALRNRETVRFSLPIGAGGVERFRLHSRGGGCPVATDPRVLNFRIFGCLLSS